jgi:hypothetical protein
MYPPAKAGGFAFIRAAEKSPDIIARVARLTYDSQQKFIGAPGFFESLCLRCADSADGERRGPFLKMPERAGRVV